MNDKDKYLSKNMKMNPKQAVQKVAANLKKAQKLHAGQSKALAKASKMHGRQSAELLAASEMHARDAKTMTKMAKNMKGTSNPGYKVKGSY